MDANGDVFVVDTANNAVKEIVAVNGSIPSLPTILTLGSGFYQPAAVAVDARGDVFVADTANNAVKEIVAVNGSIPSLPTILTLGSGFLLPFGVAVDSTGNVFVADTANGAVKEIVAVNGSIPAGATILTLGSGFYEPTGVAIDASGNVVVADTYNNRIEELNRTTPLARLRQHRLRSHQQRQPADRHHRERRQRQPHLPHSSLGQRSQHLFQLHPRQHLRLGLPSHRERLWLDRFAGSRRQLHAVYQLHSRHHRPHRRLACTHRQQPQRARSRLRRADHLAERQGNGRLADHRLPADTRAGIWRRTAYPERHGKLRPAGGVRIVDGGGMQGFGYDPHPRGGGYLHGGSRASWKCGLSGGEGKPEFHRGQGGSVHHLANPRRHHLRDRPKRDPIERDGECCGQLLLYPGNGNCLGRRSARIDRDLQARGRNRLHGLVVDGRADGEPGRADHHLQSERHVVYVLPIRNIPGERDRQLGTPGNLRLDDRRCLHGLRRDSEHRQWGDLHNSGHPDREPGLLGRATGLGELAHRPSRADRHPTRLPSTAIYGAAPISFSAVSTSGVVPTYSVTGPATLSGSTLTITGAGTVVVTASVAATANYTAASVSRTIVVAKAPLTATAANLSRQYDVANPALTYGLTGFVNGDTIAVVSGNGTLTTTAVLTSPPGTYPITFATEGLTAANYSFAYVAGTLTVTPSSSQCSVIDYSKGFASNGLSLNGSAKVTNGLLQLTDGKQSERASAYFATRVPTTAFDTVFTFQLVDAVSDGFTFIIQGVGPQALGVGGGGLGYQGIGNSIALKFDLHNNAGEGPDSTGLYLNGEPPTYPAIPLAGYGIDLHSGHVFAMHLHYEDAMTTFQLTDTLTGAVWSVEAPGDAAEFLGSNTAYFGFTAGTGGGTATQNILTWSYSGGAGCSSK